jgi:hypothetical protein
LLYWQTNDYSTANSGITINIQHIIQAFNQKLIA